jgi:hypothetical protein
VCASFAQNRERAVLFSTSLLLIVSRFRELANCFSFSEHLFLLLPFLFLVRLLPMFLFLPSWWSQFHHPEGRKRLEMAFFFLPRSVIFFFDKFSIHFRGKNSFFFLEKEKRLQFREPLGIFTCSNSTP